MPDNSWPRFHVAAVWSSQCPSASRTHFRYSLVPGGVEQLQAAGVGAWGGPVPAARRPGLREVSPSRVQCSCAGSLGTGLRMQGPPFLGREGLETV